MIRKTRWIATVVLLLGLGGAVCNAGLSADEIIRKTDSHRLPGRDVEMTIQINSFTGKRQEGSTVMQGVINNGKLVLLNFLEPANMQGRKIVMQDNRIWLVVPNAKKPIRVNASQRLMGGISYGDVAGVSFTEGYAVKQMGDETVAGMAADGGKTEPVNCYALELTARVKEVKYKKIMLWVEQQGFLPVKADFFALSGKKMATAFYTGFKEWGGEDSNHQNVSGGSDQPCQTLFPGIFQSQTGVNRGLFALLACQIVLDHGF